MQESTQGTIRCYLITLISRNYPKIKDFTLQEIGMLGSRIEDIDYAMMSWIKEDLDLSTITNEGYKRVPVLWQTPERAFQIKKNRDLRVPDDHSSGAIILPVVTVERTAITKDPSRKGGYQAQISQISATAE